MRHDGKPVPSLPHIEMTVAMLRAAASASTTATPTAGRSPPARSAARDETIEPDLSNAAPFVALAAVAGGRSWCATGRGRPPRPATRSARSSPLMGCGVALTDEGLEVRGAGSLRGVDLDLHDVGELTPAVAALCALGRLAVATCAGSRISAHHETDRLAALANELCALGADVTEHARRALAAARPPARRGVPHLCRPPDGPRRRDRRCGCRGRAGRERRYHRQDLPRLRRRVVRPGRREH